jgi:hypothetical protein
MKPSSAWVVIASLTALAGCTGRQQEAPGSAANTPGCSRAAALRDSVPGLLREGKLGRAVRTIEEADVACPASSGLTWEPLLRAQLELGLDADAARVAAAIEASPAATPGAKRAARELGSRPPVVGRSEPAAARALRVKATLADDAGDHRGAKGLFLQAWDMDRVQGRSLAEAGVAAKAAGDPVEAQRLFDRALVALERQTGATPQQKELLPEGQSYFSPDGQYLATPTVSLPDRSPQVALFERRGSRATLVATLGAALGAREIAFAPRSTMAVWKLGAESGGLLYDLETGASHPLPGAERVAFSPDGATLAVFADKRVRLLESSTGKLLAEAPRVASDALFEVSFSRDGQRLYAIANGQGGLFVHAIPSLATLIAEPRAFSATVSATEHLVGALLADPPALAVFDCTTGKKVKSAPLVGLPAEEVHLAFAHDESRLFMGVMDDALTILNLTTGALTGLARKEPHAERLTQLALTADDRRACALVSRVEPASCLFDVTRKVALPAGAPRRPGTIPLDFVVGDTAVSVDVARRGASGITGSDRELLRSVNGGGMAMRNGAVSPDRSTIALVEVAAHQANPSDDAVVDTYNEVRLLLIDAKSARLLGEVPLTAEARDVVTLDLWFAPDGRSVAVRLGEAGYLVDTKARRVVGHLAEMSVDGSPAFSADGGLVASGGTILDTRSGVVTALALSPANVCAVGDQVLPLEVCADRLAGIAAP